MIKKYKNIKTTVDGITFDSAKEARRYGELKMLERSRLISGLQLQPSFDIVINDVQRVQDPGLPPQEKTDAGGS